MTVLRNLCRSSRLLDIPAVLELMRFRQLRRRYYEGFWHRAAQSIGAACETWGSGYTGISRGGMTILARLGELRLDDHLTLDLMGNKALTYRLLAEQGCDVPRHVRFSFTRLEPALSLLAAAGPLVIKPVSGTGGGAGVTTGIADRWSLRRAALSAARFDPDLMAEEQIEGHSYRLLYLDGKLLDAVRRDPPRVVGDGHSTLRRLVRLENAARLTGDPFIALSPLHIDHDAGNYLKTRKLSASYVPASGESVILKRTPNQNRAAENLVVRDLVHPATVAEGARLAVNLGVRLAGIDIIARDISQPLGRDNGLVGEINTTPGLHHHDLVAARSGDENIAGRILNHMFATRSGVVQCDRIRLSGLRKVVP